MTEPEDAPRMAPAPPPITPNAVHSSRTLLGYGAATLSAILGAVVTTLGIANGSPVLATVGAITCTAIPCGVLFYRRGLLQREIMALVIPLFLAYQLVSVWLASTVTASVQVILIIAAAAFFAVGAFMVGSPTKNLSTMSSKLVVSVRGPWFIAALGAGSIIAGYLYYNFGVPILSDSIALDRTNPFENGYLGTLLVTSLSVVLILSATAALEAVGSRSKAPWLLVVAFTFTLLYGFGNRGLYFVPLLTVIAYQVIRYPKRLLATVLGGVSLLAVVAAAGYVRDLQLFGTAYNASLERSGITAGWYWLGPVISYFRGTSEAVDLVIRTFPASLPHPAGATFFSALLSPLPGEQIPAGVYLKQALGLDFVGTGLASGAIGGFYMDFGLIGLCIGFLILGALGRFAQNKSWRNPRNLMLFSYLVSHLWFINYAHPLPFFVTLTIPIALYLLQRPGTERLGGDGSVLPELRPHSNRTRTSSFESPR